MLFNIYLLLIEKLIQKNWFYEFFKYNTYVLFKRQKCLSKLNWSDIYLPKDKINIQKSIVKHIEYILATTRFDVNSHYLFQGIALSVRDRLLEQWNDITNQNKNI